VADFDYCYAFVLANEDRTPPVYAEVPDDPPGARAISGINSAYFPAQFAIIASLPQAQRGPSVKAFYQSTFWNAWYAQLLDTDLGARVLDAAVDMGPRTAVELAQDAVNGQGHEPQLARDGVWGPLTLAAINGLEPNGLLTAFKGVRAFKYKCIAAANPALASNLPGWLARAAK
jgi:lysozyme family protein